MIFALKIQHISHNENNTSLLFSMGNNENKCLKLLVSEENRQSVCVGPCFLYVVDTFNCLCCISDLKTFFDHQPLPYFLRKKKWSHQKFWLRATKGLKSFSLGMKENHRGTRSAHFYNSANLMVRNFKSTFKFLVQDFKVEDKGNLSKPRNSQDLKWRLTFWGECFNYEVTDYFKFIWMWVIYYHII